MVPLELQAGHPASRYRLSLAQCPSLASSRFALNTSITRQADILDRHTLAEATLSFSISAFQLFSFSLGAVTLKSDPTLSQLRHHGCKNRKQFIGFVQQLIGRSASNAAIIA